MKKTILSLTIIFSALLLDLLSKGVLLYLITGGVPLYGAAWEFVPVPYLIASSFIIGSHLTERTRCAPRRGAMCSPQGRDVFPAGAVDIASPFRYTDNERSG